MSIRLLIDMNLSPEWIAELARHGRVTDTTRFTGPPLEPNSAPLYPDMATT